MELTNALMAMATEYGRPGPYMPPARPQRVPQTWTRTLRRSRPRTAWQAIKAALYQHPRTALPGESAEAQRARKNADKRVRRARR